MQETAQNAFGFAHLWASGDLVSHTVAYILAAMSSPAGT
jgi:biopolymer transport protein ExbB